ncbi:MAG: 16S rRNA (cytosine(1402)-N(4))-methyltransferase RsmH [Alphaproteobacteria bacterium]|jgi:16S rRNA (cytosine1402-N4)-methyltransferase|nr:16S rRNA (cytosine(1402)-N(4))-methyltransferase RsmH [Alphaproteobacteria bacterium]
MTQIDLKFLKHSRPHFPVLIQEVLDNLNLPSENSAESKIYLDCTFGAGGYSEHILANPNTQVIAIDRDATTQPTAVQLAQKYPEKFQFFLDTFSNYPQILDSLNTKVDGIIMDLGFSSMQITDTSRGFSFKNDAPLAMTMGLNNTTAYEFINKASESTIADVIYYYGEEHAAKRIAKKIIYKRQIEEIKTTTQLANIVRGVVGGKGKIDPATKTFQAIRIYINDELHELQSALKNAYTYLKPQGRLAVVSFHSLEDRIVKDFFNENGEVVKKFTNYKPNPATVQSKYKILTKKPILPDKEEIAINPPSSSAKLRVVELL